jgi:hypothetical protein
MVRMKRRLCEHRLAIPTTTCKLATDLVRDLLTKTGAAMLLDSALFSNEGKLGTVICFCDSSNHLVQIHTMVLVTKKSR